MPVEHGRISHKELSDRRKKKKQYWMDKGCSEWKAEELLFRYGY